MTEDPKTPSAEDLDAVAAEQGAAQATGAEPKSGPLAGQPIPTKLAPTVEAAPADERTDGERHADLLREVSDHSAPPAGAEQVMHKPEA